MVIKYSRSRCLPSAEHKIICALVAPSSRWIPTLITLVILTL